MAKVEEKKPSEGKGLEGSVPSIVGPEMEGTKPVVKDGGSFYETAREMERVNRELLDRVTELEAELARERPRIGLEDVPGEGTGFFDIRDLEGGIDTELIPQDNLGVGLEMVGEEFFEEPASGTGPAVGLTGPEMERDVSDRGRGFSVIISDFEKEIDTALALKDTLAAEIEVVRKKLTEESAARAELQSRLDLLESQAAFADELREEVLSIEKARDRASTDLAETRADLESITGECKSLAENLTVEEARGTNLRNENADLEAQVSAASDKVAGMDQLRENLGRATKEHEVMEEKVQHLERSLETIGSIMEPLRQDLNTGRELVGRMRSDLEDGRTQIENLEKGFDTTKTDLMHVRRQVDSRAEVNKRLQAQARKLTASCKTVEADFDAVKEVLLDIRDTSRHVRERTRSLMARRRSRK